MSWGVREIMLFLLVTFANVALGQYHPYRHYTVDNGLASNIVYAAYCDSIGQMWFGTDNGVQMFNGKGFKNYFESNISEDNEVFEIYEDSFGRIWLSSLYGAQYQVLPDTVIPYAHNSTLKSLAGLHKEIKKPVHLKGGGMLLSLAKPGLAHVNEQGEVVLNPKPHARFFEQSGKLFFTGDSGVVVDDYVLVELRNRKFKLPRIFGMGISMCYWQRTSNADYLSAGSTLFRVDTNGFKQKKFDSRIVDISVDEQARIWIGLLDGGVSCLDSTFDTSGLRFLDGHTVTKVVQDHAGGYWFTTLYNGIYHVPDIGLLNYKLVPKGANKIVSMELLGSNLYVTHEKGDVFLVNEQQRKLGNYVPFIGANRAQVSDAFIFEGKHWTSSLAGFVSLDGTSPFAPFSSIHARSFAYTDEGVLFLGTYKLGFYHEESALSRVINLPSIAGYREANIGVLERANYSEDLFYLATSTGGFALEMDTIVQLPKLSNVVINDVLVIDTMVFWATENEGVKVTSTNPLEEHVRSIELLTPDVNRLYNDGDSLLWLGTDEGLGCFNLKSWELEFMRTHDSGLANNRVSDIVADKENVYVGTFSGLSVFKRSFLKKAIEPVLAYLNSEFGNMRKKQSSELEGGPADAFFDFKAVFLASDAMSYRFRLVGLSEDWSVTSENNLAFRSLLPGEYVFEIQPVLGNTLGRLHRIEFEIPRHWSRSVWFLLFAILLLTALIWLFVQKVRNNALYRARQGNVLAYYREQTVRSRMDPHFIFNSLNSLQYFLVIKDNKKASVYLSSLAKLLRKNIEYSKEDLISVREEMNLLRTYCELESMRFEGQLDYSVKVSEGFDIDGCFIPAMIIQPLVENAVWHGLNGKSGEKRIEISFAQIRNRVEINVIDNGKGVNRSKSSVQKSGDKHASEMLLKRLSLYSSIIKSEYVFQRVDAFPELSDYPGTRCTLSFPILTSSKLALNRINEVESTNR